MPGEHDLGGCAEMTGVSGNEGFCDGLFGAGTDGDLSFVLVLLSAVLVFSTALAAPAEALVRLSIAAVAFDSGGRASESGSRAALVALLASCPFGAATTSIELFVDGWLPFTASTACVVFVFGEVCVTLLEGRSGATAGARSGAVSFVTGASTTTTAVESVEESFDKTPGTGEIVASRP